MKWAKFRRPAGVRNRPSFSNFIDSGSGAMVIVRSLRQTSGYCKNTTNVSQVSAESNKSSSINFLMHISDVKRRIRLRRRGPLQTPSLMASQSDNKSTTILHISKGQLVLKIPMSLAVDISVLSHKQTLRTSDR